MFIEFILTQYLNLNLSFKYGPMGPWRETPPGDIYILYTVLLVCSGFLPTSALYSVLCVQRVLFSYPYPTP